MIPKHPIRQPNNLNVGGQETSIADVWVNLGVLHEVVGAFSQQNCLDSFWSCVCKNSHWVIPAQRMGVILQINEQEYQLVGRLEAGEELSSSDILQANNSGLMESILAVDDEVRWLVQPWIDEHRDSNPICGWLLDHESDAVLVVPLQSNNKRIGLIAFVLKTDQISDRTIMSTMATGYALYVSITYTLLQTTEKLQATNKNLETEIEERKRVETTLQVYQERLQDLVAERTDELTQANKQLRQEIIERELAEAALALTRDQAVKANELKGQLLSRVSHELRTPLNIIWGYVDLIDMEMYGEVSKEQKEILATISESCDTLGRMVNELLDQASFDAGRIQLNIGEFSPRNVLEIITPKMQVLAQAKDLALTSQVDKKVPELVTGDFERVQQILVNLTSNAIKFTAEGAINILLYAPYKDYWAIQVSDTGIGIPLDAQDRIFEPFQQVDGSLTRLYAGNGLGLSIVKELTELMGGDVTVDSEVDKGSTFTAYIPLDVTRKN